MTKKFVAAAVGTLIIAGSTIKVPLYEVDRIVDGDTFVTTENQMIRLAGVDAPEKGLCGYNEATEALTKIITGKKLYIKVIFRDGKNRLIANVYNNKGLVAKQLVAKGAAFYSGNGNWYDGINKDANFAKEKGLGIFSEKCTQLTNPDKPNCVIKGNMRFNSNGTKLYRFPGCGQYESSIVQLYMGDQWFCSETEAMAAGYTKGSDCFDKKWVN